MTMCKDGSPTYLMLYVNDMLIPSKNLHEIAQMKALLGREFERKDLDAEKKILGMEILKDRVKGHF